jgi:hypothetical protein
MSEAGKHLFKFGIQRLAQLHTHGGSFIGHSCTDDSSAYSQRVGSVSVVVPRHAVRRPALRDCGVHVREKLGWRRLSRSEITGIFTIVPTLVRLQR